MNFGTILGSLLGSSPVTALLGHAITAGLTYVLAKGYVTNDQLTGLVTVGGIVLNAAASAGRSTVGSAVKQVQAHGLVPVSPVTGQPVSEATVFGKKV